MISDTDGLSPGSVFIFPGDERAESVRRELREAHLTLFEPRDLDEAIATLPTFHPDIVLIEPTSQTEGIAAALQAFNGSRVELPPVLVLAGYDLRPLEATLLYEVGATDVVFPPHHPRLTLAKIGALLRLKRRLDAARELSVRDDLTGLYNRRFFFERLEQEIARTIRTGQGLALILFDIDLFKTINDTLGHPVGDAALRTLADAAARTTRKSDLIARMGGDEFALLLSSNTLTGALICANALRRRLAEADYQNQLPPGLRITASFGIAAYPHPLVQHPMEDLVREADLALLSAKASGRDRIHLAEGVPAR